MSVGKATDNKNSSITQYNEPFTILLDSKDKGRVLAIVLCNMSQTRDQKRFTILEVAADWHELMIPLRTMRPSIARSSEQLDPQFAASRHTTTPISHTRPSPRSP